MSPRSQELEGQIGDALIAGEFSVPPQDKQAVVPLLQGDTVSLGPVMIPIRVQPDSHAGTRYAAVALKEAGAPDFGSNPPYSVFLVHQEHLVDFALSVLSAFDPWSIDELAVQLRELLREAEKDKSSWQEIQGALQKTLAKFQGAIDQGRVVDIRYRDRVQPDP